MFLTRRTDATAERARLLRLPCNGCGRLTWSTEPDSCCSACSMPPTPPPARLDVSTISSRFPLAGAATERAGLAPPSPPGIRPWGLRRVEEAATGLGPAPRRRRRYDPLLQLMVDDLGRPVLSADPTASSVTSGDGDEGPSEDWKYDFCPDESAGF